MSNSISRRWDLLSLGFTAKEYPHAEKRIWYLKIKGIDDGPYGYEMNQTINYNGTQVTAPEFIPYINYLEAFELTFNDLSFETQFYPFFDGSNDIIIPIRGVNHEISKKNQMMDYRFGLNSWSVTGNAYYHWAVIFGTQKYNSILISEAKWSTMGCRTFAKGSDDPNRHPDGLIDYGWLVVYCLDGDSETTDMKSVDKTDDEHFRAMMQFVEGITTSQDKVIIFTHGHGDINTVQTGPGGEISHEHCTLTTKSHLIIAFWTNVLMVSDYHNLIGDITEDGTHVFLWLARCHGIPIGGWPDDKHNNRLLVWYYDPVGYQQGFSYPLSTYEDFSWTEDNWPYVGVSKKSEAEMFFSAAEQGTNTIDIYSIGCDIQYYFNHILYDPDKHEGKMYIKNFWGNYKLYVNY